MAKLIQNSDGAITNLLRVAMRYAYNSEFGYGNTNTAFHQNCDKISSNGTVTGGSTPVYDGERYQIDCSSFVKLVLMGITPESSRYMNDDNYVSKLGYNFDCDAEYDTEYKRMMANELAKYAYKKGYLYEVKDDLSNVNVGDILFWCNQPKDMHSWENIGHAGVVTDTWQVKKGETIRCRTLEAHSFGEFVVEKCIVEKTKDDVIRYGARFPLPYASIDTTNICTDNQHYAIDINLSRGSIQCLKKLNLSETLQNGDIYTLVLKADIPKTTYLKVTLNDNDVTLSPYGYAIRYDNGFYNIPLLIHQNVEINENTQIEINIQAEYDTSGTAILHSIKLMHGYVNNVTI